jgi:hypothetical protein
MSTKPKRPAVLDLGSLMVSGAPATAPPDEPTAGQEPSPAAEPRRAPARVAKAVPAVVAKPDPAMFRTSVYFSRAVHDKLRDIAHEERKTITDLINEGLDHVLTSRNYPTTSELKKGEP